MEAATLVALGIFAAGTLVTLGRLLERMSVLRRDLGKLDTELAEIKRVLYTTVGGRRAIRPIAPGELAEPGRE